MLVQCMNDILYGAVPKPWGLGSTVRACGRVLGLRLRPRKPSFFGASALAVGMRSKPRLFKAVENNYKFSSKHALPSSYRHFPTVEK